MRRFQLTLIAAAALVAGASADGGSELHTVLGRVAERLTEYYRRAQSVICIERSIVQPIGYNYTPEGFARTTESELRVESDADGDGSNEPTVIRQVRKVNGRAPREKDKKDRAGCTDPNPLSTEPLAFLLPSHRDEYSFTLLGPGKGRDRNTVIIEYALNVAKRNVELIEDKNGHEDCFDWAGPVPIKGRIWVDAVTYDIVRVERRTAGPIDVRVPTAIQRKHQLGFNVTIERDDTTIKYKKVSFNDPDEAMLLPESIDMLIVVHGGLQSTRRSQTYSDYRRFVTDARLVK